MGNHLIFQTFYKTEHLFPFIANNGGNSLLCVEYIRFLMVLLFYFTQRTQTQLDSDVNLDLSTNMVEERTSQTRTQCYSNSKSQSSRIGQISHSHNGQKYETDIPDVCITIFWRRWYMSFASVSSCSLTRISSPMCSAILDVKCSLVCLVMLCDPWIDWWILLIVLPGSPNHLTPMGNGVLFSLWSLVHATAIVLLVPRIVEASN